MIGDFLSVKEARKIIVKDCYLLRSYNIDYFKTIIDIGANIGVFSLMARVLHPNSKIVAIEPDDESLIYLKQNLNGMGVDIVESPIGDGRYVSLSKRGGLIGNMYIDSDSSVEDKVKSVTLSEIHDGEIEEPYAVKCDCEGSEKYFVGDSDSEKILMNSDLFALEIHFWSERNRMVKWLKWEEYRDWINYLFSETHKIVYHISNKHRGYGHYIAMRNYGICTC